MTKIAFCIQNSIRCNANRLKLVLDELIDKDQTGFIKGRFIGENTRLIYDIMSFTEQNDTCIPGLLVLIDFEKAFDCLPWVFIKNVLQFLNFRPTICRWIETLYDCSSLITEKDHLNS